MKFDGNSYQTNIITQSIRYHNPGSIASHFTKYCISSTPQPSWHQTCAMYLSLKKCHGFFSR